MSLDPSSACPTAAAAHNARAWDALARQGDPLARPAADADLSDPLALVDPAGWLEGPLHGRRVLCLAAGGGRHSVLYAAAGACVTVVDLSGEMLALDRAAAAERGVDVRLVQTSMDDLAMFAPGEFDAVIHPVSTCYLPEAQGVFAAVARVTRAGGLYISQHKSPASLQASLRPNAAGAYELREPYYRRDALPPADPSPLRESGTLEFVHPLEERMAGFARGGFVSGVLAEPLHAQPQAAPGSFAHRAAFVPPYLRIKARRIGDPGAGFRNGLVCS